MSKGTVDKDSKNMNYISSKFACPRTFFCIPENQMKKKNSSRVSKSLIMEYHEKSKKNLPYTSTI